MLTNKTRRGLSRHDVRLQLREMAVKRGPSAKLPTQSELCVQIGTTTSTVDEALRDLEAENIICRRQGSGIYVSPKVGYKQVAILISHMSESQDIVSPFWGMLQRIIWHCTLERGPRKEHDYSFHLVPYGVSREDSDLRKNFEALLTSGRLDGVVCVHPDKPLQELMHSLDVPFVGFGMDDTYGWVVGFDITQMFRLAASQLKSQGCRRIMLVPADNVDVSRYTEIAEICGRFDPPITLFRKKIDECYRNPSLSHQKFGCQVAMEVFSSTDDPKWDGLIILDDMIADGIIKTLYNLDILPGRDVKIATHGNAASPILQCWESQLTVIESDPVLLVESMFEILDSLVNGVSPASRVIDLPWNVRLDGEIVATG